MEITRLPARFSAAAVGYVMAVPTPPPITTTVPNFSISDGLPSGPTTSRMLSPVFRELSRLVVLPADCTTMRMVPASGSECSMVIGMRSPCSYSLRITNCPGFCLRAMRGASITNRLMPGARNSACSILNMFPHELPYRILSGMLGQGAVTQVTREREQDHMLRLTPTFL